VATATTAVTVAVLPGASAAARDAFGFTLHGTPGSLHQVLAIVLSNLASLAVLELMTLAPVLAPAAIVIVVLNAATVGAAIAAYGTRALPFLVHLPLEWTALGLALAPHLPDPTRLTRTRRISEIAISLTLAALAESYLTPQG
jgi:hypothetical protein